MTTGPASEPLHQKGANGLLAEYQCGWQLVRRLIGNAGAVAPSERELAQLLRVQIAKYSGELTEGQIRRALNQGSALGDYIFEQLNAKPENLGLPRLGSLSNWRISLNLSGHDTGKENSADIEIDFESKENGSRFRLPISLKAYAGTTTSLGSKGGLASLSRMFLFRAKVSEAEFVEYFGMPGREFVTLLREFKDAAKEFYESSPEGRAFVDSYEARKGTRRVNNKLRRAELGAFFEARRGFPAEHRFATLYAAMFRHGFERVQQQGNWTEFLAGFRFVLGMEDDILTLNAVAGEDGRVVEVVNSMLSSVHGRMQRALVPGASIELIAAPASGTLRVSIRAESETIEALSLSVWKDATIQFKLTT